MTNTIKIWQPRWHDRKVLVAKYQVFVGVPEQVIIFTKTKSLPGRYVMRTQELVKYPLETNGKVPCHAVPLADFKEL